MNTQSKLTLPDGRAPELLAPAGDLESAEAALRFLPKRSESFRPAS